METEEDAEEIEIEGLDMLPQRQMAVRTMEDGRMYVENDRTVISGNNSDMWRDQVMDYINNEIRHGKDVTFYGADGAPLTITEDTAGKARFRNMVTMPDGTKRAMTDSEFKTKLRAESHIDELAQASKGNGRGVPDNKNHPFAKDGFTYRTAYFKDPSGYYRVTMSVGINGEINTVYNVGKNKEADFPVDDVRGAQRPRGKQASDNSVYQNAGDVNSGNDVQQSARDLPETEAFKRWFGDSEVVDEDNNPLVVYHATSAEFTTFDKSKLGEITDRNAADG